jgi:PhnB protein
MSFKTSIAPNLSVADGVAALAFYKAAFGAEELYRLELDEGHVAVAQLAVNGAEFWLAEGPPREVSPAAPGGPVIRMLMTVDDPDALFDQAIAAGATEVQAVHEDHGWRSGVLVDPDGHMWELAKPLTAWPPGSDT